MSVKQQCKYHLNYWFRKGLLVLKSASVIGDRFPSKALESIMPLRNESHKSLLNLLKTLE